MEDAKFLQWIFFRWKFLSKQLIKNYEFSKINVVILGILFDDVIKNIKISRKCFSTNLLWVAIRFFQVKPPAASDALVGIINDAEQDIKRHMKHNEVDKAADMSCAVLSLVNVDYQLQQETKVTGRSDKRIGFILYAMQCNKL